MDDYLCKPPSRVTKVYMWKTNQDTHKRYMFITIYIQYSSSTLPNPLRDHLISLNMIHTQLLLLIRSLLFLFRL